MRSLAQSRRNWISSLFMTARGLVEAICSRMWFVEIGLFPAGGPVQSRDNRLLNLCPAEIHGLLRQQVAIERFGIEIPFLEVNDKKRFPCGGVGKIHEEHLVEAAFPEEFGRQTIDIVCRGCHKAVRLPLLHPREERSEYALGDASVRFSHRGGKAFLYLINPQTQGRQLVDDAQGPSQVLLGLADVLAVKPADIQTVKRQTRVLWQSPSPRGFCRTPAPP